MNEATLALIITVTESDLKDYLENSLGRKPTAEQLSEFKSYLRVDVPQWLRDNAKAFMQNLVEEGRLEE